MPWLYHRLPPSDEVGDGHDGDDDQDQRHESRANPESCPRPAAAEHAGVRLALIRLVVEELGDFVADPAVGSFEGLQSDLELRLIREVESITRWPSVSQRARWVSSPAGSRLARLGFAVARVRAGITRR